MVSFFRSPSLPSPVPATLRALTLALTAFATLAPASLRAAQPVAMEGPSALDEARAAFEAGRDAYAQGDFERAIERFDAAFVAASRAEHHDQRQRVHASLLFNLVRAHLEAYAVDGRMDHLLRGRQLFAMYEASYGVPDWESLQLRTELDARMRELDTRVPPPPPSAPPSASATPTSRQRDTEQELGAAAKVPPVATSTPGSPPTQAPQWSPGLGARTQADLRSPRSARIGGVVTGVAVALSGAGVLTAGVLLRHDAQRDLAGEQDEWEVARSLRRSRAGVALLGAGSVATAAGLATAIAFAVLPTRHARREARLRATASVTPTAATLTVAASF
jgi:hypothetical protein